MDARQCRYCSEWYPLNTAWFRPHRGRLGYKCRPCIRLYDIARYDGIVAAQGRIKGKRGKYPQDTATYLKAWREQNAAAIKAYRKEYDERRRRARLGRKLRGLVI